MGRTEGTPRKSGICSPKSGNSRLLSPRPWGGDAPQGVDRIVAQWNHFPGAANTVARALRLAAAMMARCLTERFHLAFMIVPLPLGEVRIAPRHKYRVAMQSGQQPNGRIMIGPSEMNRGHLMSGPVIVGRSR